MGSDMIVKIADNIISPLGLTTEDNLNALIQGNSGLSLHEGTFGLPEAFCASLLDRNFITGLFDRSSLSLEKYTFFEKLCILSASQAIADCSLQAENEDVIFIISTTKGNVDVLEDSEKSEEAFPSYSARKIAEYFGNHNTPEVISNACISGVCAQIEAVRALLSENYRYAVVIGADVLSKFIISGFQSFKALSMEPCKPFDNARTGLNLGEAAGTIILERTGDATPESWRYTASSNHNDANHISGPSRTGEGSFRVISDLLKHVDKAETAFINLHGTATAYNDEMESIALERAGLSDLPANGLKGFYGHTLGAAGIIETILSMAAADAGVILPTRGFETCGTSRQVNVDKNIRETGKKAFFKILSGFGGSNAGIAWSKGDRACHRSNDDKCLSNEPGITTLARVRISPDATILDGRKISDSSISGLYREFAGDYPKFFKMDSLCRLGFMGAEILLKNIPEELREKAAVILFNRNSSLITDRNYQKTISEDNYFPSPALFVYTLANIVTGEIAIRHKIHGETAFHITDENNAGLQEEIAARAFLTSFPSFILTGWVDYNNESDYLADLRLITRNCDSASILKSDSESNIECEDFSPNLN